MASRDGTGEPQLIMNTDGDFDLDWIVVGSGFGGSVSALRLAEKGYRVAVLECGRRFADEDFAASTRDARNYYWVPALGLRGVLRVSLFKDVLIVSGCGVGGGSLGYANTLYRARPAFFRDPQWAGLADWATELEPHFRRAERMLGVTQLRDDGPADLLLREYAESVGCADSYRKPPVGVFLGEPGRTVPDPYFGGAGPERTGCVSCGSCMLGCRYGAKNTLMKNYLWFAEQRGVQILPERTVIGVRPLDGRTGATGYAVTHERSGAWTRRDRSTLTARGVVIAAGALGTNRLLQRCKADGVLPRLSDRLGRLVRTNGESSVAVTAPDDERDFTRGVSITSSIYPDPQTHIEAVTYGRAADSQSFLFAPMNDRGGRRTRPFHFLADQLRHPVVAARAARTTAWSRRTIILLVMQTADQSIRLEPRRWRLPGGGLLLTTRQDRSRPIPHTLPQAYQAGRWLANRIGGIGQAATSEAIAAIAGTAHVLGGAVIGRGPDDGVIDHRHRVFGYDNLLVCDGAAIPANIGANPSLTITALAERAISLVPPKAQSCHDVVGLSPNDVLTTWSDGDADL
ncbi:GMC oxidoreductase [Microlunatus soli]|uniref:Cholesterol oxidase n=1 Tax=Microlunatus soli TaxID=630515 RepID=A0A1H1UQ91_9ACTN|nr:GMC family oxidoreductase [Microlunatus soli]SDS74450.1 cholesterol oxidase [Microlunatus soli]